MLAVLSGLIAQVVEHLFRTKVLTSNFLGVHQSLAHRKKLMLAHFDHLGQFTLFLVQARILLLLLSQFGCGIEQKLEVLRVAAALKQVNLGQELLFFLLKLCDLLLELGWVHGLRPQRLSV